MTLNEMNSFKNGLIERKFALEKLGIKIMWEEDFDIAYKMASYVPRIMHVFNSTRTIISQSEAFRKSISHLQIFDDSFVNEARSIVKSSKVKSLPGQPSFIFGINVKFSVDDDTGIVDEKSGFVDYYTVPPSFDEMSPSYLAHEHIRALKETNYKEYSDMLVFADVIPMFFELLMADRVSKRWEIMLIRSRLSMFYNEYHTTQMVKSAFSNSCEDKELLSVYSSSSMQYLNSIYYSLQLYDLYRQDEKAILAKVSEVLRGEKTTRDILNELGLLHAFDSLKVKHGIEEMEKRLR